MSTSETIDVSMEPVANGSGDGSDAPRTDALTPFNASIFKDVSVCVQAKIGQVSLTVAEILALKAGQVVKLDAALNDLVELKLNGSAIARGELVAVGDNFGVRIVEIAQDQ